MMTVAELIVMLQKLPQDFEVYADGCDCTNPVVGAIARATEDTVTIEVAL